MIKISLKQILIKLGLFLIVLALIVGWVQAGFRQINVQWKLLVIGIIVYMVGLRFK